MHRAELRTLYVPEVRSITLALLVAGGTVVAAFLAVLTAHRAGIPAFDLLRDPPAQFGFPVYGGVVSNVGVSVLTLAAGIAGFGAAIGRRDRGRLGIAALLSVLLAIDDQYMLHERVGPHLLGLPEILFYLVYALLACLIAYSIGEGLRTMRHALLLIAGAALAFSIAVDQVLPMNIYTVLAEDLAKLGGLVLWLVYWITEAARAIRFPHA